MNSPEIKSASPFLSTIPTLQKRIEQELSVLLPPAFESPSRLHTAMRYAVLNGGKRLRPLLVYATGLCLNANLNSLDIPAAAIELIHCYSLVHDDLPAMDNDDLRRGKKTCHKAFDEATAILVGDALQTLAFALLAKPHPLLSAQTQLDLIEQLAIASGSLGMAGGQSLDLSAEGKSLTLENLEMIHQKKTGALITACVKIGAIAAGNDLYLETLCRFAQLIGLAFQIKDDLLDVEGNSATLGKKAGADANRQKLTYPALLGVNASKNKLNETFTEAMELLASMPIATEALQTLSHLMIFREF